MNRRDPAHQKRVLELRSSNAAQRHANRRKPTRNQAKAQWQKEIAK